MPDSPTRSCPVCGSESARPFPKDAIHHCPDCTHWFSTFEPRINELGDASIEADIELKISLRGTRGRTYRRALDLLEADRSLPGLRHLDVGCSIGQFCEASSQRGTSVVGVEPERAFAEIARQEGHAVESGYFPDAVADSGPFDLISFMDVIGHIPDLRATGEAAFRLLADGGTLMIKTPTADGLIFRLGRGSRRLGSRPLWERLWQLAFASPQIHFFTPASIDRFAREIGGTVVASRRFPALERNGLWQRLMPGRAMPYWKAIPVYCVMFILLPVINSLPQDSLLVLIRATGREKVDGT